MAHYLDMYDELLMIFHGKYSLAINSISICGFQENAFEIIAIFPHG